GSCVHDRTEAVKRPSSGQHHSAKGCDGGQQAGVVTHPEHQLGNGYERDASQIAPLIAPQQPEEYYAALAEKQIGAQNGGRRHGQEGKYQQLLADCKGHSIRTSDQQDSKQCQYNAGTGFIPWSTGLLQQFDYL